ncbi:hypothetical protein [Pseudomonas putida]|uniref:hypothetical protein n=1 Tax=Pseudomonas putida TaxID=303 RepID=UPI00381E80F3
MKDFFKTVTTTELTSQTTVSELDVLARVSRQTSSPVINIQTIDTKDFLARLWHIQSTWKSDITALNNVINWQHRVIDFNSSYTALLLDQISEEEFEAVAEALATEENSPPIEELASLICRTLELTSIEFTPSDLANLFHCPIESIDSALPLIPHALIRNQPQLQEAAE